MAETPPNGNGRSWNDLAENVGLRLISRWVQVVGIPAGLAFMGWIALTFNGMQLSVATLQSQMQERTSDRYTGSDARHDFAVIAVQIDDISRRLGVLEYGDQRPGAPAPETVAPFRIKPAPKTPHAILP